MIVVQRFYFRNRWFDFLLPFGFRSQDGYTGLLAACELGHTDVVRFLINRYSVDVNDNEYVRICCVYCDVIIRVYGRKFSARFIASQTSMCVWSPGYCENACE